MAIPDWLSVDPKSGSGKGSISVSASTNNQPQRQYNLTIRTASGLTKQVLITQPSAVKASLTFQNSSDSIKYVSDKSGMVSVNLIADCSWMAVDYDTRYIEPYDVSITLNKQTYTWGDSNVPYGESRNLSGASQIAVVNISWMNIVNSLRVYIKASPWEDMQESVQVACLIVYQA